MKSTLFKRHRSPPEVIRRAVRRRSPIRRGGDNCFLNSGSGWAVINGFKIKIEGSMNCLD